MEEFGCTYGKYLVNCRYESRLTFQLHGFRMMARNSEGAIGRDVSHQERKLNADRLAFVGKMAAEVVHEINNQLMIIKTEAELQLVEAGMTDAEEAFSKIKRKAEQI